MLSKFLRSLFAGLMIASAVLTTSCSRSARKNPETVQSQSTNTFDLGEVEFVNGVPKTFDNAHGYRCVIKPTFRPDGELLLEVQVVEKKHPEKVILRPRISTRSGIRCGFAVGGKETFFEIALTPKLVAAGTKG